MPTIRPVALTIADFQRAIREQGSHFDISSQDIFLLYQRARRHAMVRQASRIQAREMMTREVATISPESRVIDAAQRLLTRRISGLPVVDQAGRPVGFFSEADVLTVLGVPHHHPRGSLWEALGYLFSHYADVVSLDGSVGEAMTRDVVTITPDASLEEIVDTMKARNVKRLVVVGADGATAGMITGSDLMRAFLGRVVAE